MLLREFFTIKETVSCTKCRGAGDPNCDACHGDGFHSDYGTGDYSQEVWDYAQNRYNAKPQLLNSTYFEDQMQNAMDAGTPAMEFVDDFFRTRGGLGESVQLEAKEDEPPPGGEGYGPLTVMRSGAGWYVGRYYWEKFSPDEPAYPMPGSRESGYYRTEAEARKALKSMDLDREDAPENQMLYQDHPELEKGWGEDPGSNMPPVKEGQDDGYDSWFRQVLALFSNDAGGPEDYQFEPDVEQKLRYLYQQQTAPDLAADVMRHEHRWQDDRPSEDEESPHFRERPNSRSEGDDPYGMEEGPALDVISRRARTKDPNYDPEDAFWQSGPEMTSLPMGPMGSRMSGKSWKSGEEIGKIGQRYNRAVKRQTDLEFPPQQELPFKKGIKGPKAFGQQELPVEGAGGEFESIEMWMDDAWAHGQEQRGLSAEQLNAADSKLEDYFENDVPPDQAVDEIFGFDGGMDEAHGENQGGKGYNKMAKEIDRIDREKRSNKSTRAAAKHDRMFGDKDPYEDMFFGSPDEDDHVGTMLDPKTPEQEFRGGKVDDFGEEPEDIGFGGDVDPADVPGRWGPSGARTTDNDVTFPEYEPDTGDKLGWRPPWLKKAEYEPPEDNARHGAGEDLGWWSDMTSPDAWDKNPKRK